MEKSKFENRAERIKKMLELLNEEIHDNTDEQEKPEAEQGAQGNREQGAPPQEQDKPISKDDLLKSIEDFNTRY